MASSRRVRSSSVERANRACPTAKYTADCAVAAPSPIIHLYSANRAPPDVTSGKVASEDVPAASTAQRHRADCKLQVAALGEERRHGVVGAGAVHLAPGEAAAGAGDALRDGVQEGRLVHVAGAGRRTEDAVRRHHLRAQAVQPLVGGDGGGQGAPAGREAGRIGDDEIPGPLLLHGVPQEGEHVGVDVLHGQKGGLFLDQRDNRARVETMAAGLRVLNLFGYTGGFSVYAARGGARATTTVDVAPGAIAAAARNFARTGFAPDAHACVTADVFAFLRDAVQQKRTWELVISDPPSFAPCRRALPAAIAAYERLHGLCAQVVASNGLFCAASCSSPVAEATFLRTVSDGFARPRREPHAR